MRHLPPRQPNVRQVAMAVADWWPQRLFAFFCRGRLRLLISDFVGTCGRAEQPLLHIGRRLPGPQALEGRAPCVARNQSISRQRAVLYYTLNGPLL